MKHEISGFLDRNMTIAEVAAATGKSYDAVRCWASRSGHRFKKECEITYREKAMAMPEGDAVEYLLDVIDAILRDASPVQDPVFNGHEVTPIIRRICNLLASREGQTFSKDAIYNAIYFDRTATDDLPDLKMVDLHVFRARKALPSGWKITTVWGTGYRIERCAKRKTPAQN